MRVRDDHFTDWVHELNWFEATVNNLTYQASLMHGWALNHKVFPTLHNISQGCCYFSSLEPEWGSLELKLSTKWPPAWPLDRLCFEVKLRKACWVYWTSRPSISYHVLSAAIVWEESLEIILCKVPAPSCKRRRHDNIWQHAFFQKRTEDC